MQEVAALAQGEGKQDEYGLVPYGVQEPPTLSDFESMFDSIYKSLALYHERGDYHTDHDLSELLVDFAFDSLEPTGIDPVDLIYSNLDPKREEADDWAMDWEGSTPYPNEDDYATEAEYEAARDNYEDEKYEELKMMWPFGFFDDVQKAIEKALWERYQMTPQKWWEKRQNMAAKEASMLKPYFNLVKEAQNQAQGINEMFGGLAGGITQGAQQKMAEYAQLVIDLKNSNPQLTWQQAFDQIMQQKGVQGMQALKEGIITKIKELASPQQPSQPTMPEEITQQPQAIPVNRNPY